VIKAGAAVTDPTIRKDVPRKINIIMNADLFEGIINLPTGGSQTTASRVLLQVDQV
jgi:hypothetical protein